MILGVRACMLTIRHYVTNTTDSQNAGALPIHLTAIVRLTHPNQAKPESALPAFGLRWPWQPPWRARRAHHRRSRS
jgi:hypothetical protein